MNTQERKKRNRWIIILVLMLVLLAFVVILLQGRKTEKEDGDSSINPFPFGDRVILPDEDEPTQSVDFIDPDGPTQLLRRKRFRQITDFPVSGFKTFNTEGELLSQESIDLYNETKGKALESELSTIAMPRTQYVEQETGFVKQTVIGEDLVESTLANTLIPDSVESFFSLNGDKVLYRYLNERTRRTQAFLGSLANTVRQTYVCPYMPKETLALGDVSEDLITIKNIINMSSENDLLFVNKEFDEELKGFLLTLQKENSYPETGELDELTLEIFKNACSELAQDINKATDEEQKPQILVGGSFLEQDISFVSPNPFGNDIFYLLPETLATTYGKSIKFDSAAPKTILETPFSEWIPQWVNNDLIMVTTAASGLAEGYVFQLDIPTNNFKKIIGPKFGLTSLANPSGEFVLYSETDNKGRGLTTRVYNTNSSTSITLPIKTLPEKCTWSLDEPTIYCAVPESIRSSEVQPDSWYKGISSMSDKLWKVTFNPEDPISPSNLVFLLDPKVELGFELDITKPALSPEETFLLFVDSNTNHLWSLEVDGLDLGPTSNFAL